MIVLRPKKGQRVVVRYGRFARYHPHDGEEATVLGAAGPGLTNWAVRFDGGLRVVVPRGNLFPA